MASLPGGRGQPLPGVADSALFERNGIEQLFWRGDLNGDLREDFITDYGYIGSQPVDFAVWLNCGSDRYRRVLHVFASHLGVLESGRGPWRDLRAAYELFGIETVDLEFFRWTGARYAGRCRATVALDSVAAVGRCPCC